MALVPQCLPGRAVYTPFPTCPLTRSLAPETTSHSALNSGSASGGTQMNAASAWPLITQPASGRASPGTTVACGHLDTAPGGRALPAAQSPCVRSQLRRLTITFCKLPGPSQLACSGSSEPGGLLRGECLACVMPSGAAHSRRPLLGCQRPERRACVLRPCCLGSLLGTRCWLDGCAARGQGGSL